MLITRLLCQHLNKRRYETDGVVLRPCVTTTTTGAGDDTSSTAGEVDDDAPLTVDRRKPVSALLELLAERCVETRPSLVIFACFSTFLLTVISFCLWFRIESQRCSPAVVVCLSTSTNLTLPLSFHSPLRHPPPSSSYAQHQVPRDDGSVRTQ